MFKFLSKKIFGVGNKSEYNICLPHDDIESQQNNDDYNNFSCNQDNAIIISTSKDLCINTEKINEHKCYLYVNNNEKFFNNENSENSKIFENSVTIDISKIPARTREYTYSLFIEYLLDVLIIATFLLFLQVFYLYITNKNSIKNSEVEILKNFMKLPTGAQTSILDKLINIKDVANLKSTSIAGTITL
ncbi:hypothetical protein PACTADRAFT_2854 [Pachysolen tannophilus NRRL Y-2460]|uniref:Uncharacterized protein n=1 Tax=Pachysolen tannophilus NRRL Y-2460 TaxID=669874 RepID=A0A1E4TTU7_PACTA|nr:hypothetical protein PACTADRAFT_2854 [Pachysolen tannophilus NRRL Y-2460]